MPAEAAQSGPLLSTIYRQSWPPPSEMTDTRGDKFRDKNSTGDAKIGIERPSRRANVSRPFSARLISPKKEKTKTRPMSARRPPHLPDARGLRSATFLKRTVSNNRIPEYDAGKVISESAAARNKALAAEYIAMLQGRNYMKKQYREQYWVNDVTASNRPPAGRYSWERRYPMLYPDLGSVIGGRAPVLAGTSATPSSPPRSAGPWRLSTSSITSANTTNKIESDDMAKSLQSESSTTILELGTSFGSKKSWSNVPSGKCYRVLSHPNDTLASLCLEGRSASRTSNSRTSSMSSITAVSEMRRTLSSTGESTPSGSSDAIGGKSQPGSGDEEQARSVVCGGTELGVPNVVDKIETESDPEVSIVHGISDAVFYDDDNEFALSKGGEDLEDDEFDENNPEDGAGRLSYSDLEESDISENEAGDYEEEVVDENEVNRRLQQVSAVFDTSKGSPPSDVSLPTVHFVVDPASEEESSEYEEDELSGESQADDKDQEYQFADFLPHPYADYDFRLFAALPSGMDWRAFLQPVSTKNEHSVKHQHRRSDTDRRRAERRLREREVKRREGLEDTVDRLIMLEKLQALSVQYEQDRRRHLLHRAKARNIAKAATNNQNSTTSSNAASNEFRPASARPSRRRLSTTSPATIPQPSNNKTKKSLSSSELRNEPSLNKSSPELQLVRLSCSKNQLQFVRLSSFSSRRRTKFGLPRHYEYSWSERVPPSKRPSLNSLVYTKPRNCPSCRESEKRVAQVHTVHMMLGRPRSAYGVFSSEQQKLHQRPNTTNATARVATDNPQSAKENRLLKKDRTPSEKLKILSPPRDMVIPAYSNRMPSKKSEHGSTQDKIFAARAILSSVARDYARAARRGGKLSRRSSAPNITATRSGRGSQPGVIRYRKDANVLKTHVIDSSSIRLK